MFVAVPGQAPMAAVKSGDVVSGTETFTTNSFGAFLLNDAGQVVFSGPTSAVSSGIFVVTPGSSPEKIVAVGDTAPGGGTFASFASPSPAAIDGQGHVAFFATVTGGSGGGLFLGKAGTALQAIASNGSAAPSGGNYAITSASRDARLNARGDLLFQAALTGGSADSGLFLRRVSSGAIETVALQGQTAPGVAVPFTTINTTANAYPGEFTELGPGGEVWFANRLNLGDHYTVGVFGYGLDRVLSKVLVRGQAPPDGVGSILAVSQGVGAGAPGRFYVRISVLGGAADESIITIRIATRGDLTGDGLPDLAVFRPSNRHVAYQRRGRRHTRHERGPSRCRRTTTAMASTNWPCTRDRLARGRSWARRPFRSASRATFRFPPTTTAITSRRSRCSAHRLASGSFEAARPPCLAPRAIFRCPPTTTVTGLRSERCFVRRQEVGSSRDRHP